MLPALRPLLPLVVAAFAFACAKKIGDPCSLNSDCSINGDRVCDLAQPGGYCTIPGCEPDACPTDSMCVYFDAHSPRLRRRYCVAGCSGDDDCRDGYRCVPFDPPACVHASSSDPTVQVQCNRTFDSVTQAGYCVRAQ